MPKEPEQKGWQIIAEARIRGAMEAGAFDNLPGAGKPIPDLDETYDENWWLKKWMKRERIGITPPTLAARLEIARELERIEGLASEALVTSELAALNEKIRAQNKLAWAGPPSLTGGVDEAAILERWRAKNRPA
ncbi:MAG: DUF1992 domain-containing protein [Planctomycetota bacterium]|nr:DUF1992 domain-containing protein [Planctomycetota bacterium]